MFPSIRRFFLNRILFFILWSIVAFQNSRGYVLLIVNVASKCGLTSKNYEQLTKLDEDFREKGLRILAFPCNQFSKQVLETWTFFATPFLVTTHNTFLIKWWFVSGTRWLRSNLRVHKKKKCQIWFVRENKRKWRRCQPSVQVFENETTRHSLRVSFYREKVYFYFLVRINSHLIPE